jgi:hypothetical protein
MFKIIQDLFKVQFRVGNHYRVFHGIIINSYYTYIIRIYSYLVYKFSKIYIRKNKKIVILVAEHNAAKAEIHCTIRKNTKGAGKK